MTPPPNPTSIRPEPCVPPDSPWDSGFDCVPAASFNTLPHSFISRPPSMSENFTYVDAVDMLDAMMSPVPLHALPLQKVKWNRTKAFAAAGDTIVNWIVEHRFASGRKGAAEIARQMVRMGGFVPMFKVESSEDVFRVGDGSMYIHRGMSCLAERGLNCGLVYRGERRNILQVMKEISLAFGKLVAVVVEVGGHWVDYDKIRGSAPWREVLVLLTELVGCDESGWDDVDDDTRKLCWMNLYNVLIFHAKLVWGHPMDLVKRGKFFNDAAYVIAGKRLTSVELEHEVLRRKMAEGDPRSLWRVKEKDARMHFILNCGAQSCPPLLVLKDGQTEEMLKDATRLFIEKNCEVDLEGKKVVLSRLWKWFRNDFTPGTRSDNSLLQWIAGRASEEKSAQLAQLMKNEYKIKFSVYNWADNGNRKAKPDVRFMFIYDRSFERSA